MYDVVSSEELGGRKRQGRKLYFPLQTIRFRDSILYQKRNEEGAFITRYELSPGIKNKTFTIKKYNDGEEISSREGIGMLKLLEFDLSKKTMVGLYTEEVLCMIIENTKGVATPTIDCINLEPIGFDRTGANLKENLDLISRSSTKDFTLSLCFDQLHFTSAIVHYKSPTEKEFYVFDSAYNDRDDLIPDIKQLNTTNLQGRSNLCGYFASEFIIRASRCKDFSEIQNQCVNNQMQENIIQGVKTLIEKFGKNFDTILKSNKIINFEEVEAKKEPIALSAIAKVILPISDKDINPVLASLKAIITEEETSTLFKEKSKATQGNKSKAVQEEEIEAMQGENITEIEASQEKKSNPISSHVEELKKSREKRSEGKSGERSKKGKSEERSKDGLGIGGRNII